MLDRESKATFKNYRSNDGGVTYEAVYKVGQWDVAIPVASTDGEPPELRYAKPHYESTDPRRTFPNMSIKDGAIEIPIEDLVDEIVARSEPADLAKALWTNDEVKAEFMYCLRERYSQGGLDDADRRKFLRDVQEAIHSTQLDKLVRVMTDIETAALKLANTYAGRDDFLRFLDGHGITDVTSTPLSQLFKPPPMLFDTSVRWTGGDWNAARDHWRAQMLAMLGSVPPAEAESDVD